MAKGKVAEADLLEDRELLAGRRPSAEEHAHFRDGHGHEVPHRLAVELKGQHLVPEALAVTGGAGQRHVGDELHLDRLPPCAAAAFTTPFAGIE